MSRLPRASLAIEPYHAFVQANKAIEDGPLDRTVYELSKIRASQINGCLFCIDMHVHETRDLGETDDRIFQLPAWRESELYTEAERAALAYTEAATRLGQDGVPDAVWAEVTEHFSDEEAAHLVMAVALINAFNRIAVPLRVKPPRR